MPGDKAGDTGDRIASEEQLIREYFAPLTRGVDGAFDLSDDCAVLTPEPGRDLVLKTDPVISGLHFFADDAPEDIAWKALAVNISDLAAKSARPEAYLMALTLPEVPDRDWMRRFANGFETAQNAFGCRLIGGDTDHDPGGRLAIAITVFGSLPTGTMVRRGGARPGDHLVVSGVMGDAALGLAIRQAQAGLTTSTSLDIANAITNLVDDAERAQLLARYLRPAPRLALSAALRAYASAAMDISDGLVKDAARMCRASGVDATIHAAQVPVSKVAQRLIAAGSLDLTALMTAGDDYEILAAVPPEALSGFKTAAASVGVAVYEIGMCQKGNGDLSVVGPDDKPIAIAHSGYDHFSTGQRTSRS